MPDSGSDSSTAHQPAVTWDSEWWKPKDRRRDLIRAGALIVAEIERLDRNKGASAHGNSTATKEAEK